MALEQYITENNITVIKEYDGHIKTIGKSANEERNKYYMVKDNITTDEYYIMECHKSDSFNIYFKFDKVSLPDVLKVFDKCNPTWFQSGNGYIITHIKWNGKDTCIHLHQYLMNYYGQKNSIIKNECNNYTDKTKSIDHINRNPLDNRLSNLRIINQSHQNHNQMDRPRGTNLDTSYDTLKQFIPKNIYFKKATIDKNGLTHGEHFTIEIKFTTTDNVKQRIRKKTTKAQNITLPVKLIQAIKIKFQIINGSKPLRQHLDIYTPDNLEEYKLELQTLIKNIADKFNIANTKTLIELLDTNISFNKKLEKFNCPHCNKSLTGKSSLTRHVKTKH